MPAKQSGIVPPCELATDKTSMAHSQPKKFNKAKKVVILPGQCRAARGLLDISQRELAEAAEVSLTAIKDFEAGARSARPATVKAIQNAIEAAGILLIPVNGGGQGVRLREPDKSDSAPEHR